MKAKEAYIRSGQTEN